MFQNMHLRPGKKKSCHGDAIPGKKGKKSLGNLVNLKEGQSVRLTEREVGTVVATMYSKLQRPCLESGAKKKIKGVEKTNFV